ncbi:homocysteine S-methyltransferase family protein [bacterium]|nr:homocysteine S-methyltransferase family protein [bacterium]
MASYRDALPQLSERPFLTDGGIETTLIFHEALELPHFAAFHLLASAEGRAALEKYFRSYLDIARRHQTGIILESATWRASPDWAARLGYTPDGLAAASRQSVELLHRLRDEYASAQTPVVVSGCFGPRGDGYVPDTAMSAEQAADYHGPQARVFAEAGADMACAITMNYAEEAVGVARAARAAGLPAAISFTVETDGRLPTGQTLGDAIAQVDADTGRYPAYYMINCAHPTHFADALAPGAGWLDRIRGVRANASRMSHAELNEAPVLDVGNPAELGTQYAQLKQRLKGLTVMGGCCGTDTRHIEQIASACVPLFTSAR